MDLRPLSALLKRESTPLSAPLLPCFAELFSEDGPGTAQRSLYDHCDSIDRLALAHSCSTYFTIHCRAERRRELRWGDIELNVRNPEAGAFVTANVAHVGTDGTMIALPRPRPATDLQRRYVIHRKAELSLYSFEEYPRPPYISPAVWNIDPDAWTAYKGVQTPSGCLLKSAKGVEDTMFGTGFIEKWRAPAAGVFTVEDIAQIVLGRCVAASCHALNKHSYRSTETGSPYTRYSRFWTEKPGDVNVFLVEHLNSILPMSMAADNPKIDPNGLVFCFASRFASASSFVMR